MSASFVVVVGSVNVDYQLQVERLPGRGETVLGDVLRVEPGGKGGNAAVAAHMLGARSVLVAAVGSDPLATEATSALAQRGVDITHIAREDGGTGAALVLVDPAGENQIAIAPGANARLDPAWVADAVSSVARTGAAGAVLANFEVSDAVVLAAGLAARAHGLPFVLDPAPARPLSAELASVCTVLTPNETEAAQLGYDSPHGLLAAGAAAMVVTAGRAGSRLYERGEGPPQLIPAFPAAATDTVGAGDAFAAGVAVGLAEDRTVRRAVQLGSAAGALATEASGARGARYDRQMIDGLLELVGLDSTEELSA